MKGNGRESPIKTHMVSLSRAPPRIDALCVCERVSKYLYTFLKNIQFLIDFNRIEHLSALVCTRCKYFDACYARATVVRARFLAATFSDGSYLAHVNGAYLRHVTFCIVRGPPLFSVSPISERGSRAAAHLTCRGTPASPILAVM